MKLRLVRLLAPLGVASVLLFQPAITNTAQATVPGIDDEMNDIQSRLLSGFAAMEFDSKPNGGGSQPTSHLTPGRDSRSGNPSSHNQVNQNWLYLTDPALP